jgi:hypothetical protein
VASHNNNNGGEKYNPFRDNNQEESPWENEQTAATHSPYNPFANPPQQQQQDNFLDTDTTVQHYSPSDLLSTNDLIDLQQSSGPQSPAQAALSLLPVHEHVQPTATFSSSSEPSTVSSAHFPSGRNNGKQKGKAYITE